MSVIERVHDSVLDKRSDAVVAEFVAEGFRVVATVSGETPQVTGVASIDLRADCRIVFLRGGQLR